MLLILMTLLTNAFSFYGSKIILDRPNHFGQAPIVLDEPNSFWSGPNHFGQVQIRVHLFWEGHKILRNLPLLLSSVVPVKNKVEISQDFVAFSEYMNFINIGPEKCNLNLTKMI